MEQVEHPEQDGRKQFVCSTITPQEWQPQHRPLEKCGQIVVKFGEYKKSDLVKCLKINNLQGLICASGGNTELFAEVIDA